MPLNDSVEQKMVMSLPIQMSRVILTPDLIRGKVLVKTQSFPRIKSGLRMTIPKINSHCA